MPSQYLTAAEAPEYGLSGVNSGQIIQASTLIDAYLRRPEGLVWVPDSSGQPCYMAAATPTYSLNLASEINPGTNVPVTFSSGPSGMLQVGDVVVLDAATPSLTEACVVATTTGTNGAISITLQTVMNAHQAGAQASVGLLIEEQRSMPADRPITRVAKTPVVRLVSGIGRYAYGRRGDGANYNMEEFNLLAALSKFGGPPVWELFQAPLSYSWDARTGQVWVPAGIMLAYYSEVKLLYVAGFAQANIPPPVKFATAQVIEALANQKGISTNLKSYKAGDTTVTRFAATLLDVDTKNALVPYGARLFV